MDDRSASRILLVEDNEMNRDMLSRRLRKRGYVVETAADGQQAVERARNAPGIVLLDMSLPVLDGWTVAGQLKQGPVTKRIPIIALTAHAMMGDRERAIAAGCDDYESKPVNFDSLLHKIEALLARSA